MERSYMMRVLSILALAALVAAGGCSSKKTVYDSNGNTVTSDSNGKTVTVQSSGGTMTMGQSAVDLSKLGVPVYPGATQSSGGFSYNGSHGSGQMTSLTTGDAFDKVYAWYKSQLPKDAEKMKSSSGDSSFAEFVTGAAGSPQTTVMISSKGDQTSIVLSKGSSQ
ncbi:MAG TPA: hypothetical protein VGZ02_00515 [Candidatus Baltobacteraceae bacterium]|jgi:hypothetical protein|nr:hypothetical protein [Candidatus Baltobacteraceae bacterium]